MAEGRSTVTQRQGVGYCVPMNAYQQLRKAVDFIGIPASFPNILFGDDIYVAQAQYIRRWLRRHPQKGDLLSAILLAATSLEQLAAFRFDRAEVNMQKAAERIIRYRSLLRTNHDA